MTTQRVLIQISTRGGAQSERAIRRVGSAADASRKAVNGFRNVLVALAAVSAAKGLVDFVDTATRIDNRLRLVSGSTALVNRDFNRLLNVATNTRSSLESTIELYARLQRSTENLGLSQDELINLTTATNQAFQIYGATAEEARAAVVQFSQGLAAGAIRGDELRSVLEQGPRLAKAIADGLTEIEAFGPGVRVGIGDLRDLGREGQLTADLVSQALITQADALENEFNQTNRTISEGFVEIQNQLIAAFREAENSSGVFAQFAEVLFDVSENVGLVFTVIGELVTGFGTAQTAVTDTLAAFGEVTGLTDILTSAFEGASEGFSDFAGQVGGATLALTLLFGPLGFTAGLLGGVALALGRADTATTELTTTVAELTASLREQFAEIDATTTLLDENRILSLQTAQTKLQEAISIRENIKAIRDETAAKREALRQEVLALITRGRELQGEIGAFATIFELDDVLELREVTAQLRNAGTAFNEAGTELDKFDEQVRRNQENIDRLQALIADGSTLTDFSTEATQRRADAEKELEKALKEQQKLEQQRIDNGAKQLQNLANFRIGTTTAAERLKAFNNVLTKTEELVAQNAITTEDANRVRTRGALIAGTLQTDALNELVRTLEEERMQLMDNNLELEARDLLISQGFNPDSISDEFVQAIVAELEQTRALNDQLQLLEERRRSIEQTGISILGDREGIAEEFANLIVLYNELDISAQQFTRAVQDNVVELANLRLEAGDGTFADALLSGLEQVRGSYTNILNELTTEFSTFFSTLKEGFADSVASAIVDGDNLNESLRNVAREGLKQLISGVIQLGIQFALNQVLANASQTASVKAAIATGGAIAAAYAPAAAATSLASFGANAAPATAAIVSVNALSRALAAIPGFRDGTDFVSGPGGPLSDSVLARLSRGEGVVNAEGNARNPGVVAAMNRGEVVDRNSGRPVVVNVTLPNANPDDFRRNQSQIIRETKRAFEAV